jgi:hypothetical protein
VIYRREDQPICRNKHAGLFGERFEYFVDIKAATDDASDLCELFVFERLTLKFCVLNGGGNSAGDLTRYLLAYLHLVLAKRILSERTKSDNTELAALPE